MLLKEKKKKYLLNQFFEMVVDRLVFGEKNYLSFLISHIFTIN